MRCKYIDTVRATALYGEESHVGRFVRAVERRTYPWTKWTRPGVARTRHRIGKFRRTGDVLRNSFDAANIKRATVVALLLWER